MIILDTNVLSALMRPELNGNVIAWLDRQPHSVLWLNAISIMEVRSGLLFMPEGKRRAMLAARFDELLAGMFDRRVLSFDQKAADCAASVDLAQHKLGRDIGIGDIEIAGICLSRHATLATRNTRHFADLGLTLIDPWTA